MLSYPQFCVKVLPLLTSNPQVGRAYRNESFHGRENSLIAERQPAFAEPVTMSLI